MNTNQALIDFCVEKLKAEQIEASVIIHSADPDCPRISVPRMEDHKGLLSQFFINGFISCKLDGNKRKGFATKHPVTGEIYDIYVYDPDSEYEHPDASEIMSWSAHEGTQFDWTNLSLGDAEWLDGWELTGCEHLEQRPAFLAYLLSYEVIDLPEIAPLTIPELKQIAASEMASGKRGRFCHSINPNDNWHLQVTPTGELVLLQSNREQPLHINRDHIDSRGRLVIDGHIALTRSTPL
jgi:hypothetical protein